MLPQPSNVLISIISILILSISESLAFTYVTSPSVCKKSCLDAGSIICPVADKSAGYCCTSAEVSSGVCPKTFGFCSSDMKGIVSMQRFLCPYINTCGPSTYAITATAAQNSITVSNNLFASNYNCQYLI